MRIFALNLCIQFEVKDNKRSYSFEPISFEELMGYFFKGTEVERQQFYVWAGKGEEFRQNVFDLQAHDVWRELEVSVTFLFNSPEQLEDFEDEFVDMFKHAEAAGGLVINEKGEYLCIYNREKWTLPKGGVEWRERIEDAAVREVKEETGLPEVEILHEIEKTYHTFRRRRKWVLKTTHWYKMKASSSDPITPQKDEKIEDVAWMDKESWLKVAPQSYPLTRQMFEDEFAKSLI